MTAALRVIAPGLMTTLQDLGRPGYQQPRRAGLGRARSREPARRQPVRRQSRRTWGAGDRLPGTGAGRSRPTACALPSPEARPRSMSSRRRRGRGACALQSVRLREGQVLRIGALAGSAIAYLAVEGGFDVAADAGQPVDLCARGIGGFAGRALQAGDLLPLRTGGGRGARGAAAAAASILRPPRASASCSARRTTTSREAAMRTLLESAYTVSPASDRMGMRLDGPSSSTPKGYNIVSDGIAPAPSRCRATACPSCCSPTARPPAATPRSPPSSPPTSPPWVA